MRRKTMKTMAVYVKRHSDFDTVWHYGKLAIKTAFAFGIGYVYLIVGFCL